MVFYTIEKNISICEKIWKKLSDNSAITDLWEYKYCFFKGYSLESYFICAYEDNTRDNILAFIPLELYSDENLYMMFGAGDWNEYARVYFSNDLNQKELSEINSNLFKMIPENSDLRYFSKNSLIYSDKLKEYKVTYYLDVSHDSLNSTFEFLLNKMSKDGRKHLKKEIDVIERMNPKVVINNFSDISEIIKFNKLRFKDDSSFSDPGFERAINLIVNSKELKPFLRIVSVLIDDKVIASHLCSFYLGVYTALQGGNDISIPNLSKYLMYLIIKDAEKLCANKISFMADDCGWKEHWRLDKEMLFRLKK